MQDISQIIEDFFRCKLEPFTGNDFRNYLKAHKIKISLEDVADILYSADCVFGLINDYFITRAGAFTNQLFSFQPTKEEVEQGGFVPGHRFMPFADPAIYPYNAIIVTSGKEVPKTKIELNTNTVLDLHALFGEGYIIPYVLSDPACDEIGLASVQYGLPKNLMMTAFSLQPFFDQGFEYGDRILCKVVNWDEIIIEAEVIKCNHASFKMSEEDMIREEWYSKFESAFLKKIEKCGPTRSIEEQLAFLFLEEQRDLCIKECGSCSEFLEHTSEIDFEPYGIESRIWKCGEEIPFVGEWNKELSNVKTFPDLSVIFADYVIDSFIKNSLYKTELKGNAEEIFDTLFPKSIELNDFERKFALLHLEKRIDIVKRSYSRFVDYPIASVRTKILSLFSKICSMMNEISNSNGRLDDFPQYELIVLAQLLGHTAHLLEELECDPSHASDEKEDILTSLDGMIETFEGIEVPLQIAIKKNKNVIKVIV